MFRTERIHPKAGLIKVVPKSESILMKIIGAFLWITRICPKFMESYWTTIGDTVYTPRNVINPCHKIYDGIWDHEAVHVMWFKKHGVLLAALLYILVPLPFIFSGRWYFERDAYLQDIRSGRITIQSAVDELWSNYGWCWPKRWMHEWFFAQVNKK
jgi:hypothetical protein